MLICTDGRFLSVYLKGGEKHDQDLRVSHEWRGADVCLRRAAPAPRRLGLRRLVHRALCRHGRTVR